MAFGFAPLTNFEVGPKPFVLASVMFFASFALAVPRLSQTPLHLPGKFVLGGVLLTVTGFVATPFAASTIEHLIFLLTAIVGLFIMPAMVAWMSPTTNVMYACVIAFGAGAGFSTIYGLQHFFYRNAGFTYHPVALAYTCMLAISFVPFIFTSQNRSRWLFLPPLVALAMVGIWTSGSRTGLVVIGALAVLIPILERSVKVGLAVLTGLVLLLPSVVSVDTGRTSTGALSRLFGGGGATSSDTVRLQTIEEGYQQIRDNPIFGNGYSVDYTYVIHNIYLQVLQAQGLIGLVGLLLIFTAMVAPLRRASSPQRTLAYPAYAAIIAGPFQPNMGDHYLALSLGLAMTAVVNQLNKERKAAQENAGADAVTDLPQTGGALASPAT
jgi:O-antigen ligase